MSSGLIVDLFVEDRAHEEFLKALLARIAREHRKQIIPRVRSARGGHGRALQEFSDYQDRVETAKGHIAFPDLVIVAIDANCKKHAEAKRQIEERIHDLFENKCILACPDPHIERWFLADQDGFAKAVGSRPRVARRKCQRSSYKAALANAVIAAGHPPMLGGIEFAQEIVDAMDFYRASKADRSLKYFLDQVVVRLSRP